MPARRSTASRVISRSIWSPGSRRARSCATWSSVGPRRSSTMARPAPEALRRLAAEIEEEVRRIEQSVAEASAATTTLRVPEPERLRLYGGAALLDTFYSGVEKALGRVAKHLDGGPPA